MFITIDFESRDEIEKNIPSFHRLSMHGLPTDPGYFYISQSAVSVTVSCLFSTFPSFRRTLSCHENVGWYFSSYWDLKSAGENTNSTRKADNEANIYLVILRISLSRE